MDLNEMHVWFRQYAQQMGMQNVRAILPEQIDTLINTSIKDTIDEVVRANVGTTNDRVITDNAKLASVNALRTSQEDFPVRVDASASGLQLLSILTHDVSGLKLNGLLNNGYQDIYLNLFELTGLDKEAFSRKDIKSAIMTSIYGSIAEPKKIFKTEDNLNIYYKTLKEHIPNVYEFLVIQLYLKSMNQVIQER